MKMTAELRAPENDKDRQPAAGEKPGAWDRSSLKALWLGGTSPADTWSSAFSPPACEDTFPFLGPQAVVLRQLIQWPATDTGVPSLLVLAFPSKPLPP